MFIEHSGRCARPLGPPTSTVGNKTCPAEDGRSLSSARVRRTLPYERDQLGVPAFLEVWCDLTSCQLNRGRNRTQPNGSSAAKLLRLQHKLNDLAGLLSFPLVGSIDDALREA